MVLALGLGVRELAQQAERSKGCARPSPRRGAAGSPAAARGSAGRQGGQTQRHERDAAEDQPPLAEAPDQPAQQTALHHHQHHAHEDEEQRRPVHVEAEAVPGSRGRAWSRTCEKQNITRKNRTISPRSGALRQVRREAGEVDPGLRLRGARATSPRGSDSCSQRRANRKIDPGQRRGGQRHGPGPVRASGTGCRPAPGRARSRGRRPPPPGPWPWSGSPAARRPPCRPGRCCSSTAATPASERASTSRANEGARANSRYAAALPEMRGQDHRPPAHAVREPAEERREQELGQAVGGEEQADLGGRGVQLLRVERQQGEEHPEPDEVEQDGQEDGQAGPAAGEARSLTKAGA